MQYDENAEKYGYEGEMTPMKCDKLKSCKGDVTIPVYGTIADADVYLKKDADAAIAELEQKLEDAGMRERRLKRALWLAKAERYKMREFIAREEGNLCNQMSWSRILRERTYEQWVGQLLRIANLANKLQNKCRAKAEEHK